MKHHFTRFLGAQPHRLHAAAHSHHPWPDATLAAHDLYWRDSARLMDDKWEHILGTVVPKAQGALAGLLALPDPTSLVFAPNTHEFVLRLVSCLPTPANILTTDSEFHSFTRQTQRLEEAGLATVTRVPTEPFDTFPARFRAAIAQGGYDLLFFSHVFFNSGYVVPDLPGLVAAVPNPRAFVVIDGYHGFMALPTDLSQVAARAFYMAGGYKYAMSGEGVCFLHCPPGYGERPVNTGWYATFGSLAGAQQGVAYSADGYRFAGATFDPSGLYRLNAVMDVFADEKGAVADIHAHVKALQENFLRQLKRLNLPALNVGQLVVPQAAQRGNFLTFRTPDAQAISKKLHDSAHVITDARADRLRFGFGIYHDGFDMDDLVNRVAEVLG